jgi:hypothetical protein
MPNISVLLAYYQVLYINTDYIKVVTVYRNTNAYKRSN